jgi:predicted flap endonuclease-1-like 5' DNA nuclease
MRSDYALYVVSVIFFAITVTSLLALKDFERNVSIVATVVLGLLFAGVGYTQRQRVKVETTQATQTQTPSTPSPPQAPAAIETAETPAPQKNESIVEPIATPVQPPKMELTTVKGIKEKRAEQLRAQGISSIQDLANASAEDLAKKLKIAQYFTERWIQNAKEIIAKS